MSRSLGSVGLGAQGFEGLGLGFVGLCLHGFGGSSRVEDECLGNGVWGSTNLGFKGSKAHS